MSDLKSAGAAMGLPFFAELVVCGIPGEVAGENVVLGLNRSLFIADQPAGDERADNGMNGREESEKADDFEGGSGQHGPWQRFRHRRYTSGKADAGALFGRRG